MKGSDFIKYVYFDVDNKCVLPSLHALHDTYMRGTRTVHLHVYPLTNEKGEVLYAMSNTFKTVEAVVMLYLRFVNKE